jgi:hypothetical protein
MKKTIFVIMVVSLLLLAGWSAFQEAAPAKKSNVEVVKRLFEALQDRDNATLDELLPPKLAPQAKGTLERWHQNFSTVKIEVDDIFGVDDKVAVRWSLQGKKDKLHGEDWQIHFVAICQVHEGKVQEMWHGDNSLQEFLKHGFKLKPPAPKTLEGKLRATMGDMKTIGLAMKAFIEDWAYAPKTESIRELETCSVTHQGKVYRFSPFYIKVVPTKDAWDHYFFYKADGKDYWIGSGGSDGQFDGFDQQGTWDSKNDQGQDIVFSNGTFVYGPGRLD